MKAQWAEEWESRISSLADAGKLKFKEDGQVDIVDDPAEQSHLQESRRKEKQNQIQPNPMTPPRLQERFDQNSDWYGGLEMKLQINRNFNQFWIAVRKMDGPKKFTFQNYNIFHFQVSRFKSNNFDQN